MKKDESGPKLQFEEVTPLFPIEEWNQYHYVLNGEKLSNNSLEAYHADLRRYWREDHPSMQTFLIGLRKMQTNNEIALDRLTTNDEKEVKKASDERKDVIRLVQAYSQQEKEFRDPIFHLENIATLIQCHRSVKRIAKRKRNTTNPKQREKLLEQETKQFSTIEKVKENSNFLESSDKQRENFQILTQNNKSTCRRRAKPRNEESDAESDAALSSEQSEYESRPSHCESVVSALINNREKEQQQKRGRGRPRKGESVAPALLNHNESERSQKRGRGRPSKRKSAALTSTKLLESEQPPKRGRGRPRKGESVVLNSTQLPESGQQQKRGRGRPRKGETVIAVLGDQPKSEHPPKRGRGRPKKSTVGEKNEAIQSEESK